MNRKQKNKTQNPTRDCGVPDQVITKAVIMLRLLGNKSASKDEQIEEQKKWLREFPDYKENFYEWINSMREELSLTPEEREARHEKEFAEYLEREAEWDLKEQKMYAPRERDEWDDYWDDAARSVGAVRERVCQYSGSVKRRILMNKKFELTNKTVHGDIYNNGWHPIYQIRALRDIPEHGVKAGDLGGYVQYENNLSQEGNCWIKDAASAVGDAVVSGNALIKDAAVVCRNANIKGDALVCGGAYVGDDATISGNATVAGHAVVKRYTVRDHAIIGDDATVDGDAFHTGVIEGYSEISGKAKVGGSCSIRDHARITGNADVAWGYSMDSDNTLISGSAVVDGSATVKGYSRIGGNTHVFGYVYQSEISGKSRVDARERLVGQKLENHGTAVTPGTRNARRPAFLDVLAPEKTAPDNAKRYQGIDY